MSKPKSKSKNAVPKRPDGQIRQSQMISMYGPGAMVDLVDRAVVIGGLEHWSYGADGYQALDDPRLRRSLVPRLKGLDPNLDLATEGYFRLAPACDAREPSPKAGVRALEFPRWFVCQGCRRLARAKDVPSRPTRTATATSASATAGRTRSPSASSPPASAATSATSRGSPSPTRTRAATAPSSTCSRVPPATSPASSSTAATATSGDR
jgi:hypothetical protein